MSTLQDVARVAQVSVSTVSYVLNQRGDEMRIKPATRQRVLDAAESSGYQRNELVRAVLTRKNMVLGFLAPHPEREHVARMLAGALDEADAHGYLIKVMRFNSDPAQARAIAEKCLAWRVAGVTALHLKREALEQLHALLSRSGVPLRLLDDHPTGSWGGPILTDYERGMELSIEHLRALGHRRIAHLSGPRTQESFETFGMRAAAFKSVMHRFGMQATDIVYSELGFAHYVEAAHQLLALSPRPTAIIAGSDHMGLSVERAARQRALEVPRDVSVIAVGDLDMAGSGDPPLTAVHQPFLEMGHAAARQLIEAVEKNQAQTGLKAKADAAQSGQSTLIFPTQHVAPRLIVRESTGVPLL